MKRYLLLILFLFYMICLCSAQPKTLYGFTAKTIEGELFDFSVLKGKKVMIVNTATGCSLAPQLKKLQQLYEAYRNKDFVVIAFPSNDFANREPGNNQEIKEICESEYHITFTLMEKIHVKGDSIHPVYQWLTSKEENGILDKKVLWNFQKFLITKNGMIFDCLGPIASPNNKKVIEWILAE